MIKVAITGGIGSGKSFVCSKLEAQGIRVYDCDAAAKHLINTSEPLKSALKALVGESVYDANGHVQKHILAEFLLANEHNKQAVNNVIHPAVAQDFEQSGLNWLESAILFESNFNLRTHIDKVICVSAPLETRVNRVISRDNISQEQAQQWINGQMKQEEILALSDFEIINDGKQDIDKQIKIIIKKIH